MASGVKVYTYMYTKEQMAVGVQNIKDDLEYQYSKQGQTKVI